MPIHIAEFGTTPSGEKVHKFTLTNCAGHEIQLIDYGAHIISVKVPDRSGKLANVNLGYDNFASYLERHPYLGSTVGRFCNRIADGSFSLDGQTYKLAVNNGRNHLHGGVLGFDRLMWSYEEITSSRICGIRFHLMSPDGQEGYPGNLSVSVDYQWNDHNELTYSFQATTDKSTVINLTNHAYWNLSGEAGEILQHELQLNCEKYLPIDETLLPVGRYESVTNTPLDFRTPTKIGTRIAQVQKVTSGYDHCFVVDGTEEELRLAARISEPNSGRVMEVLTTQPGIQLYTGNHLSGSFPRYGGFCLETQHFPDSPNKPNFPTTRLDPGQTFNATTVHRFLVA